MDKNVELLLQAEQEANRKVKDALERKWELLKSINREADIALESYRRAQQIEYNERIREVSLRRSYGWWQSEREIERSEKNASGAIDIEQLKADYEANRESVVDFLVEHCMKVDIEVPRVVKGDFDSVQ